MDVNSPDVWRGLAEQARTVASTLHDPGLRAELLAIAARYEIMARHAATLRNRYPSAANTNEVDIIVPFRT